jgi:hypothetical protein
MRSDGANLLETARGGSLERKNSGKEKTPHEKYEEKFLRKLDVESGEFFMQFAQNWKSFHSLFLVNGKLGRSGKVFVLFSSIS